MFDPYIAIGYHALLRQGIKCAVLILCEAVIFISCVFSLLQIAFSAIYNYLDFSADRPFLSAYDISPCFSENDKLKFQVKFPGKIREKYVCL